MLINVEEILKQTQSITSKRICEYLSTSAIKSVFSNLQSLKQVINIYLTFLHFNILIITIIFIFYILIIIYIVSANLS